MAVSFNKFNCLSEDVAEKIHNFDTDTLKVALSNTAPNATDTQLSQITQISAGNGYTTGGEDVQNSTSRIGGTTSVVGVDVTWTASGGNIGPFQYVILYNDTAANDPVIGYWPLTSAVTVISGAAWKADFGSSLFTVS
jgi:hypothetical protein